MHGFLGNIEEQAEGNRDFRRVIYTGPHLQLVLMSLEPGEEIGSEVHADTDQFFGVEEGWGEARIGGAVDRIESGTGIVVPAGTRHNIRNTGHKALKLYTLYAPPHHPNGTTHRTKADAERGEAHAAGQASD